jgi:HK97 family phage major capsid protein
MFEFLPTAGYVRLPVLLKVYPVSKSTWWAGIKSGKYPAGIKLSERVTGVVLNPTDWADIELQKDSTGQYIWVDVTTGGESKVWRLAVVPTNAIAAGNFWVGDFAAAAVVYDRQEATIEISREHGDNLVKNVVTILVEERLGSAVEAPGALVYGSFNPL